MRRGNSRLVPDGGHFPLSDTAAESGARGAPFSTERAHHTVPHEGIAAVLVAMACDNDTCPGALAGRGCEGTSGCEQCSAEMFHAFARQAREAAVSQ